MLLSMPQYGPGRSRATQPNRPRCPAHAKRSQTVAAGDLRHVPRPPSRHRTGWPRCSTSPITADTYCHLLPTVGAHAAEAAAALVTRHGASLLPSNSPASDPKDHSSSSQRTEFSQVGDGAPPGTRTPNPLILGLLFRLVADRCDDLGFSRSRTLDVCGRLVLFRHH
jgi:hypothetical protein